MQATLDQELDTIERNSEGWYSLTFYDRTLLQRLSTCLESCLAVTSDNTFLNMIINRQPQVFDMFEYVAAHLFKQWYHQQRTLIVEQLNYLTIVGKFNRRLTLTLQNDNDDIDSIDQNSEHTKNNLEHHKRVRELLFDNNKELFDILMKILPNMNKNELDFIEMIISWYESYMFFEHSYIDSTLDEKFLYFNHQIIRCLNSNEYQQCILSIENSQTMIITIHHRFFLGICTMAMGIHVNCDENECDNAKIILELYLSNYIIFINNFLIQNQINLSCLTGIITFLINYTLIIDNDNNRQLLINLFSLILNKNIYMNICINWSTYETILIDSIICYLIIYCFDNHLLIQYLIQTDENYIKKLENLIEKAQTCGNRRIEIMSQLFLLILISSTINHNDLSEKLFLTCLNYIQMSLQNIHSYHYNRIPMSMFFKSLIHIVKYDYIQELICQQYLNLFTNVVINYEIKNLYDNIIYCECTMITLSILWSLSFNENIKNLLKQNEQNLFDIIQKINKTTNEMSVQQVTCGLLYNLDQLDLSQVSSRI
ncbi:unnamed protein product [Rotaria sp. Silwood1]|nr:unnamed protein product [Rotaria sp. Silwood1]CAF3515909.1 unnamed protein product [Rotaria sp. Silwood1]CAF4573881.1 unnamed protein product [Rotaria sp. Silwood1]CAF4844567.1 unnamed protein product [Rotaria sp. Silwood1]